MNSPVKKSVTVWIDRTAARLLSKMSEDHRAAEAEYVEALVKERVMRRDARIRAAAVRAERWPQIAVVVAHALVERLAEPDLAGPWPPLTEAEAARLSLSGGWPGPQSRRTRYVQRSYDLPAPLVIQLRTAAWRMSEEPLSRLEALGMIGPATLGLSEAEQAERARLAARLYPPGRIVREALDRYGPVPAPVAPVPTEN
ncbi:hypothetical protein ACWCXH_33665 [Kitasatospora sp. NPDC001660]